jgi:hypothetical protein
LAPKPLEWTVDGSEGNPAPSFFSQADDNLDNAMVREVTVDGDHSLEFDIYHNTEPGYDWMYVQVSTDGGDTWTSIPCAGMNATGTLGPAYEGDSGGFFHDTCDVSSYAGQTIAISFRYVTDGGVVEPGVWLDNIDLGGSLGDGSDLSGWQSPSQYNPAEVEFLLQLLVLRPNHTYARIGWMELDSNNDGSLTGAELDSVIGTRGGAIVSALVTYLSQDENSSDYADYSLWVNGVLQPGGSV